MLKKLSSILISSLFLVGAAHANDSIITSNNQMSIDIGNHFLDYHELTSGGQGYADSEVGSQPAAKLSIVQQSTFLGVKDIYTALSYEYSRGLTDYTGALQNLQTGATTPYNTVTRNATSDYDLRIGRSFAVVGYTDVQVTPFFDYGYHSWSRFPEGAYGYQENYANQEAGLGLLVQYAVTPKLVVNGELEFGHLIDPKMDTAGSPEFILHSRASNSLAFGVDYAMTRTVHVNMSYQLTSFQYGQSAVNSQELFEPDSKTAVQSVMAGIGLHF